ncbi:MAG: TonB C-terminal domain-containing protein [Candidatus Omnitrophica bacterium]|nr:TonB C-terminal domain-containing protein [Candidatus Omnitrophota bacterium]MCM8816412.1 TonB C-terminal domain-containing protein [Candidatus Omnitrophota bacterium]
MRNSFFVSVILHVIFIGLIIQGHNIKNKQNEKVYVVDLLNLPPEIEISKDITSAFRIEKAEAYIKKTEVSTSPVYNTKTQSSENSEKKHLTETSKNRKIGTEPSYLPTESFSPEQYMAEIRKKLGTSTENYTTGSTASTEKTTSYQTAETKKSSLASKIFPLSDSGDQNRISVGFSENKIPAGNIIPLEYLENMKRIIQKKWKLPEERNYSLTAYVSFRVKRDGTITDVFIEQGSGVKAFDESALKAIREIERIQPLPITYKQDYLDVTVKFNMRGIE